MPRERTATSSFGGEGGTGRPALRCRGLTDVCFYRTDILLHRVLQDGGHDGAMDGYAIRQQLDLGQLLKKR